MFRRHSIRIRWTARVRAAVWFAWGGLTVLSLAALLHLWLTRERVLYLGKTVSEQRVAVLERAGIWPGTLDAAAGADALWPQFGPGGAGLRYQVISEPDVVHNTSYLMYLLAPRVPVTGSASGDAPPRIRLTSSGCVIDNPDRPAPRHPRRVLARLPFLSLPIAFVLLTGVALLLEWLTVAGRASRPFRVVFSPSERIAIGALVLVCMVVVCGWLDMAPRRAFLVVLLLGVAGWISRGRRMLSRSWSPVADRQATGDWTWSHRALAALPFLATAVGLLFAVCVVPDDWDAWAIWGPKAKVLLLGSGALSDVAPFGHPDYPLLWPSLWGFTAWCSGGGWEEQWVKGWGPLCMLLTALQISRTVRRETGRRGAGLVAGAAFVSMPIVPIVSSWAYAEAPLWLMTACAMDRLLLWRGTRGLPDAALAGLFLAAAVHTKNDGVLFAALCGAWMLWQAGRGGGWRSASVCLACFAVLTMPWFWWTRHVLRLGNHVTDSLASPSAMLARAASRLPDASRAVMRIWADPRQWSVTLWAIAAASIYALVRGPRRSDILVPLGVLAGYFGIMLIHHADVLWQVGTSWNRLTIQVLPPLLCTLVPAICARSRISRRGAAAAPGGASDERAAR